ncbi:hypothetical protein [Aliarcobacter butzleri]|uniref:hypothetical protein n=1 Tax=Aliarcobacter butzleri TaxID=28197 RepID=UPI002B25196D|nr:hypothetical protein [Aliarcobacter butzleri]
MIKENPFYILDATTRDNRQKIVEVAEEKSFDIDEDLCQKARSDLTMPRNRVLAELNWLPGVSPKKISLLISQLKTSDKSLYSIEGIPDLARINILMELLGNEHIKFNTNELEDVIIKIINNFENLNTNEIIRDINEDRTVSGFPELNDYELVENHLSEKKRSCIKLILKRLNNLETLHLIDIMTRIVDDATANGEIQASAMIEDLVDDYKLHTQNFLEQEFEKIRKLIEVIQNRAEEGKDTISPLINKLLEITRNWDNVAQPIQLSMKSRGLDEPLSYKVANTIRLLSIELTNDYGYVELSQQISEVIKELFAELPEIVEKVEEDIDTLDDLFSQIQESKDKKEREERQFQESLNYSVEIGILMKDKLSISSKGITWKDKTYSLESITRVSWGATRHSINGIPTGTTYTISFGDDRSISTIETKRGTVYEEVIDRLWKTTGLIIITKLLKDFKNSQGLAFSNATIWDDGITLIKPGGWFSSDEKKKFGWSEIEIYSSNGNLIIQSIKEKTFIALISYQGVYNTHFLEQLIRMKFKDANIKKLSDLLEK